jgi:hypothetical protein
VGGGGIGAAEVGVAIYLIGGGGGGGAWFVLLYCFIGACFWELMLWVELLRL